jgi:hypothetical protein
MAVPSETIPVVNDAPQVSSSQLPACERRPRFKLIKLEERIAPGGIIREGMTGGPTGPTGVRVCTMPTAPPTFVYPRPSPTPL